ncbi:autoinducer binding domain-containing protein [Phaeobacter italicus]|jgi:DNA-binding CsgD family transcriptional regulator|uniref:helix-turn-helix transcriptional regulator n=1 Tax=Phaeobacter italicus TaxID=481446 RepID=UPI000619E4A0|nr:autoinducer binding domain-containing protein [Phaeobacter italicus]MEC8016212.1 autoinducer binding domain-containing protein [Pseudomonadota bacterium]MBY6043749.1 autoinducer binding domain-containing protein [Phaeobacter italicus]MCA0857404.1 autoinducer binding domain-containing protein [Phaeobacter italicus]MCI5100071.1 autoinducer binding domain-containing protein [Phaeobacter italicus]MEE2818412.1 autoinducer binding domain-containing protein [Pseudomonadota bacterium]
MAPKVNLDFILEMLDAASTVDGLREIVERVCESFGVDHAMYHWVDSAGDHYYFGTYKDEWVARYQEKSYVRVDPVIIGCYQRFHPVDWRRLDWSSKPAREFMQDARDHDVGNQGYSIPIRGPKGQFALFTVSNNCDDATWDSFIERHSRDLILMGHYLNRKVLEFEPDRGPGQVQPLSPREIDALTLLAMGYSRAQVAQTLSISEHTLRVYIESARFKLGAINTTHAIARALSLGLIII